MRKKLLAILSLIAGLLHAAPAHALVEKGMGWLPPVVTANGRDIDSLYRIILVIVVILFVLTEGVLLYTILVFRKKPGRRAASFHGSTQAEIIWTLTPAAILAVLTIMSGQLWSRIRFQFPKDKDAVVVQVLAEQFAWNFRYTGPDGVFGTADDVVTSNDLHVPVNRKVVLKFSSKDVIHSFFQPEARVKQDVVPGLQTRFWFEMDRLCLWDRQTNKREFVDEKEFNARNVALDGFDFVGTKVADNGLKTWAYQLKDGVTTVPMLMGGQVVQAPADQVRYIFHPLEIGCAQLCGTLHFAMRGEVRVQTPAQFDAWMATAAPNTLVSKKFSDLWDKYHADFNKPTL
jgi:heme/copper-type cytochrome/quinol oxidase subunit 2